MAGEHINQGDLDLLASLPAEDLATDIGLELAAGTKDSGRVAVKSGDDR